MFGLANRLGLKSVLSNVCSSLPATGTIFETLPATSNGVAMLLGGIRGKKTLGGGNTRNRCGTYKGKRRGLKVYDGQRVPEGTILLDQLHLYAQPGWNVEFKDGIKLVAKVAGRVIITTERTDLDWTNPELLKRRKFPLTDEVNSDAHFHHFVHVIPDKDHQYFKLVDQV